MLYSHRVLSLIIWVEYLLVREFYELFSGLGNFTKNFFNKGINYSDSGL